jgi:hypothetical protein
MSSCSNVNEFCFSDIFEIKLAEETKLKFNSGTYSSSDPIFWSVLTQIGGTRRIVIETWNLLNSGGVALNSRKPDEDEDDVQDQDW